MKIITQFLFFSRSDSFCLIASHNNQSLRATCAAFKTQQYFLLLNRAVDALRPEIDYNNSENIQYIN